ncbi:MAG: phosphatidate cytidylyltransferase [Tepidiforma sp.]|uniref:phosphatidate cytidylyltransferase n=1 Tax=Tepidiforma TaxID=2682228 RepID=UPI0017885756|nr:MULTISPECIES: phosphatidate cytidylyltransferase [Tepidiforma]GIW15314.1 MAG: phosphatidate cytidylyltransferase [Tepidiforma sp.]
MSNLQQRVLTAAVGLPIVLGLAWVGGWPFALAVALVSLLASLEFVHGWLIPSRPIREAVVHIPTIAIAPVTAAAAHLDARFVLMGAAFAAVFAALGYAPTQAFGPRKPFRVYAGCTLYLGVLASMLVLVRDAPNGREWFFIGLVSTFAVDTGAYAVGRAIGRHRMAPRISPKKTWEGAAGGYATGAAAVLGLNALFETGVGASTALHLAVALPIAAMAGDLFESWMKRRMGVKDASGLLPGHGGFMDRLDSVLFVFPVVELFLRLRVL